MNSNDIRNQHGAVCWAELTTEDPKAAKEFYGKIFDWTPSDKEMPDDMGLYTCFETRKGDGVAGAMTTPVPGMPNCWGMFISVDDVDVVVEKVVAGGGSVLKEAFDCPEAGRMAYLADPQGAAFAIIKPKPCS